MLASLKLKHVGPAPEMALEFAPRFNLITGDNGLGKTFLLDVAWWVLTGAWAGEPAWPHPGKVRDAHVGGTISIVREVTAQINSQYNPANGGWSHNQEKPNALMVYIRADGGAVIFDPVKRKKQTNRVDLQAAVGGCTGVTTLSSSEIWNGLSVAEDKLYLCDGLLRDWVKWQDRNTPESVVLAEVLRELSPHIGEQIRPGKAMRVWPDDVRDIPTLEMPYGTVPVTLASAGMKRILALAYLLVWAYSEHTTTSSFYGDKPTSNIVILFDEVEAHLHPQWQRMLLPALSRSTALLSKQFGDEPAPYVQIIASTHSPLVMASMEPHFDEEIDRVFNIGINEGSIHVDEVSWAPQGDAVGWLVSETFGLKQARSKEAEEAIEAAEAFMRGENESLPDGYKTKDEIHEKLLKVVPAHDPFWPRWIVKAEQAV